MMDGINTLKNKVTLLLKKSRSNEDAEDEKFVLKSNEERKCVRWTIENIQVCPLIKGEYLESPPFFSGYLNNIKWTLRFYPRGRNSTNLENVGLFINRISSSARCFVNYEFKLLDSCLAEAYFSNQSVSEGLEECGTDEFLSREDLSNVKLLKIECNLLITYFDEAKYHISTEGFPNCSCVSLSEDLRSLYYQQKCTDANLIFGKENMPVHKAVLGARSKIFSDMFKEEKKRGSTSGSIPIDLIKGISDESVMRNLIEYVYTGTVDNLTFTKAMSMYPVAKKYSLKELKRLCTDKILATMSVENFCRIAGLADHHQSAMMKLATKNFFCNHSAQILDREDWKNFILERRSMASEMMEALSYEIKANENSY